MVVGQEREALVILSPNRRLFQTTAGLHEILPGRMCQFDGNLETHSLEYLVWWPNVRDEVNKRRECNQVSLAMKFVPDGTDSFRSSIKEMTFKGCNICQDISSITSSGKLC